MTIVRKLILRAWPVLLLPMLCFEAAADAQDITRQITVTSEHRTAPALIDGDTLTPAQCGEEILLEGENMAGLYLIFQEECPSFQMSAGTETVTVTTGGILHFWVDLTSYFGGSADRVELVFPGECRLNEISAFTPGLPPQQVQRWQEPAFHRADLLLFPAHGDDEQLFFAGVLPDYAGERGLAVQVIYMTDHRNLTGVRVHEMLDGLWAVGVRNYPVFGPFPDFYSTDREEASNQFSQEGIGHEELLGFVVEQLRLFKPLAVLGHDPEGEYGHGMHRLYSQLVREAVEVSADPEAFPASAQNYGVWDVPKTYLHLYPENEITMNWDLPLVAFGGMTAYQVSRDLGYPCHRSQWKYFAWYYEGADTAAQVSRFSPCRYGLFRSTVGPDRLGADFLENTKCGER